MALQPSSIILISQAFRAVYDIVQDPFDGTEVKLLADNATMASMVGPTCYFPRASDNGVVAHSAPLRPFLDNFYYRLMQPDGMLQA